MRVLIGCILVMVAASLSSGAEGQVVPPNPRVIYAKVKPTSQAAAAAAGRRAGGGLLFDLKQVLQTPQATAAAAASLAGASATPAATLARAMGVAAAAPPTVALADTLTLERQMAVPGWMVLAQDSAERTQATIAALQAVDPAASPLLLVGGDMPVTTADVPGSAIPIATWSSGTVRPAVAGSRRQPRPVPKAPTRPTVRAASTAAAVAAPATTRLSVVAAGLPAECNLANATAPCSLWGMNAIRVPQLWQRLSAVPAASLTYKASHLDNGVYRAHNNLSPSLVPGEGLTPFLAGTPTSTLGNEEVEGHGTHTLGTMAGAWGGGDGRGIVGVTGAARVVPCLAVTLRSAAERTVNGVTRGSGDFITECLAYAANTSSHWVSSNSWTVPVAASAGDAFFALIRDAITSFVCNRGGIFVVAAGNGLCRSSNTTACNCTPGGNPWACSGGGGFFGQDVSDPSILPDGSRWTGQPVKYFPAFLAETLPTCVVPVAATDIDGRLARFSNWGGVVRISAPGVDVLSDWTRSPLDPWASASVSGTSMATPHVSGALLLLRNAFPNATAATVVNCIYSTATQAIQPPIYPDWFPTPTISVGRLLDVNAAYDCVASAANGNGTSPSPPPPAGTTPVPSPPPPLATNGTLESPPPPSTVVPSPPPPPVIVVPSPPPPPPAPPPPPPSLTCTNVSRSLTLGSCSSVALTPSQLATSIGAVGTITASPPGPYSPGVTRVTVTSSAGPSCVATVTVNPCQLVCSDATVAADTTTCTAELPTSFIQAGSLGGSNTGLTIVPPGPYTVGVTAVTVRASYGNVTSAPSTCQLTVSGSSPSVVAKHQCLYRTGTTASYCFSAADLVVTNAGCSSDGTSTGQAGTWSMGAACTSAAAPPSGGGDGSADGGGGGSGNRTPAPLAWSRSGSTYSGRLPGTPPNPFTGRSSSGSGSSGSGSGSSSSSRSSVPTGPTPQGLRPGVLSWSSGRRLLQDASEAFTALAMGAAREATEAAAKAAGVAAAVPELSAAAASADVAAASATQYGDSGEVLVASALLKVRRLRKAQQPRRQPFTQLYKGWGGSHEQLKQYKPPSWSSGNTYVWQGNTFNWQETRSRTTDAICAAVASPAASLCVTFGDGGAPLQRVTGSVTVRDPSSGFSAAVNVLLHVWNAPVGTRPSWIPEFCMDASG